MNIIFICTGNTCRSPMAEVIAKHKLKNFNIKDIKVFSGGLAANSGSPITKESAVALKKTGYKTRKHLSKNFADFNDVKFDYIFTMTSAHKEWFLNKQNVKSAEDLIGFNIIDPFGGSQEIYDKCINEIEIFVNEVFNQIITIEPPK